jgi:cobalt-zinc-cadmium efflux system protein
MSFGGDHQEHGHDHAHAHGGLGHSHAPATFGRAFAIGTGLNLAFLLAELGFGYAANSLALISDAIHNMSDVLGLLLAWGGAWLAGRRPRPRYTYGFRRASILAALGNAVLLFVAVGAIAVESIHRLIAPEPVAGFTVVWVAVLGIFVNGTTALLFMRGREHDLNIRAAFLHMAADALVSLGVAVAALAIMQTGWIWLDPAMSFLVAVVVFVGTWNLARASLDLALDAVPDGIDEGAVRAYLAGLAGVSAVHDLHIWAMSTTETALTARLVRPGAGLDDGFLAGAAHGLKMQFGIRHATLQVAEHDIRQSCTLQEPPDSSCVKC